MKTLISSLFISALLLQSSCNSEKQNLTAPNIEDMAITTAISDFSKSNEVYNNNTIFLVTKQDVLKSVKTDEPDNKNYSLVNGLPYQNFVHVQIHTNPLNISGDIKSKINTKGWTIPSRYLEKDGKLFFWKDAEHNFTQNAYDVLEKYDLLENESNSRNRNELTQEGKHYYFCPKNFEKFITLNLNEDISDLKPPILDCIE